MTYAFRLVQFPIGMVGVAIATGALPVMAAAFAREAMGDMKRALHDSLRLAVFLALPAMVGLSIFAVPIIGLLFERGAFTRSATLLTASILSAYAVGLVFYVANRILAPAFYAMHDTWSPVATGMASVGVNIATSLLLMGPLGAVGLGLATAAASAGNCLQLVLRLQRRVGLLGGRAILWATAKVVLACLPMAAWGLAMRLWWPVLEVSHLPGRLALIVVQLGVSVTLFGATASLVGCEELGWAWDLIRRRRARG